MAIRTPPEQSANKGPTIIHGVDKETLLLPQAECIRDKWINSIGWIQGDHPQNNVKIRRSLEVSNGKSRHPSIKGGTWRPPPMCDGDKENTTRTKCR